MSITTCTGTSVQWNGCNLTQVAVVRQVMRPKPAAQGAVFAAPVGALLMELYFDECDTVHAALRNSVGTVRRLRVYLPDAREPSVNMKARLKHFTVILKPCDPPRAKLLFVSAD